MEYICTEVYFTVLREFPGLTVGEVVNEEYFRDPEYGGYMLFNPNNYPEYFKRSEVVKKKTWESGDMADSLAEVHCSSINSSDSKSDFIMEGK